MFLAPLEFSAGAGVGCEEVMRDGEYLLIQIVAMVEESFECVCEREGERAGVGTETAGLGGG